MDELLRTSVEELRNYFKAQLTILKGLCDSKLIDRAAETRIVIASACSTGTAMFQLGENLDFFYAEMMMLGRAFIEKLTNYCYLQVCDDIEYKRFFSHPFYKMFHNSDKIKHTPKVKLGVRYSGKDDLKKDVKVAEALGLFSDSNPRMNWSKLNVDKKVAIISQRTKIQTEFFLMNTLTVYSNASEALHGSLYGCALPTGAYTLGIDHTKKVMVYNNLLKNAALLYVQLGSMIDETIKFIIGDKENLLLKGSQNNEKHALDIMKIIFETNDKQTK